MDRNMSKAGRKAVMSSPFVPPSSWTARPRPPTSCRCHNLDMDPLVAAVFHNENCSALCRLPEELTLAIIEHLDLGSSQCLRRTCRLFLRLYSSPQFSSSHSNEFRVCRGEGPGLNLWQQAYEKDYVFAR
ncbi:hypothetical protein BX600DRAFT_444672 [Xylariales sp. PMI_506]|nr:hypothetical protein BX600DRAFT_444672 [Xylariales sp. PMI_506]